MKTTGIIHLLTVLDEISTKREGMNPAHLKKKTWWCFFLWLRNLLAKTQKLLDILTFSLSKGLKQRRLAGLNAIHSSFHGKPSMKSQKRNDCH